MYKVLIPIINPKATYYLCNGYGGVATVKGSDINIHGHFVTDSEGTHFKIQCTYTDHSGLYSLQQVKKRNGNLLVQCDTSLVDLQLSWYNRSSDEHVSAYVTDDLKFSKGLWICKDYEPKLITNVTDALILPCNSYTYQGGMFRCDIDSGLFDNEQVYISSEDVRFYCRCHAVSDKSMAQRVRLTNEQLAELNARIKNLTDYCEEQGIALVYDNDYSCVCAYKNKDLPEGYEDCIDDCDNDDPHSMTVPWSGLRKVDIDFGYVNHDWQVQLNYTEPKKDE